MKMLIEQLQVRVEKAEAEARQSMEKLKPKEESDSNRLLNESLARRYEESTRLLRDRLTLTGQLIDSSITV